MNATECKCGHTFKEHICYVKISSYGDTIKPDERHSETLLPIRGYGPDVGTHKNCKAGIEYTHISDLYSALTCRHCGRLVMFPVEVTTWEALMTYLQRRKIST